MLTDISKLPSKKVQPTYLFLSSFIENKYNSANTHWVPLTCEVLRYTPWGRSQVNEGRSLPSRSLQSDGWFISRVKGRVTVVERALDWKSILHPALPPTCYMMLVKSGFLSGPKFPHLSKESGSFSSDKLWLWAPALPFHTGPSSTVWSENSRAQASFAHCGTSTARTVLAHRKPLVEWVNLGTKLKSWR